LDRRAALAMTRCFKYGNTGNADALQSSIVIAWARDNPFAHDDPRHAPWA
jgi:hypothetical protein